MTRIAVTEQIVTHDPEEGLSYIYLVGRMPRGAAKRTIQVTSAINLDFDANGHLIGIELLRSALLHPALMDRSVGRTAHDRNG